MKNTKITRPFDPYSSQWALYWAQNPGMHRSVGAAAADDPEPEPDAAPQAIDPAEYQRIQSDLAKHQEELQRYKAKHAEAEKNRKEQEAAARRAAEEAAKKSGDVDALEKSWAEKYTSRETELSTELESSRSMIYDLTVGSASTTLAARIALQDCAEGLEPHIRTRLKCEIVDGKPTVKVLGKDGRPSAMTMADLEKELKATPYLAPLIKGTDASGTGHKGGGDVPDGVKTMARDDWERLSPGAKSEFFKKGGRLV